MPPGESKHPSLFLDTSIQIQRILAPSVPAIGAVNRNAITSSYVLMEYQRSLVADFAHVQRQFIAASTLREALTWIVSGGHSFRPRSLARCIQIAALALGEQSTTSLTLARDILDIYLRSTLLDRFHHNVSLLPDHIGCDLVATGIRRRPDGTYTVADACRQENAICRLPEFLAEHKDELHTVASYLAAHPNVIKQQPRVERLLKAVLSDPRAALGQASCWPLGDVIIAIQVPLDAALWTLDSDFEPLAAALGLRMHK